MQVMTHAQDANLQELRDQLASRMALLLLITASILAGWLIMPSQPISLTMFALLAALAGVGVLFHLSVVWKSA